MNKPIERAYTFDLLKLLSIAIIVLHHYQQITQVHFPTGINWFDGDFYWGYLVELFFIISGFFSFGSVEKIKRHQSFAHYYLYKYLRFFPMLAICGVFYIFSELLYSDITKIPHATTFTYWGVLSSLTGFERWFDSALMVNNPMWYVSVLLLCLLILYPITRVAVKMHLSFSLAFGAIIPIGLLMRAVCRSYGLNLPFFNESIARGLICFYLGLCLATALNNKRLGKLLANSKFVFCTCLSFVVTFILTFHFFPNLVGATNESALYLALCFIIFPSIILICNNSYLKYLLNFNCFQHISGIAYNMYTWHTAIILLYAMLFVSQEWALTSHLAMYGLLALCFLVAILSYRFIDTPISTSIKSKLNQFKSI